MRSGSLGRVCGIWCCVLAILSSTKADEEVQPLVARKSRQVEDAEPEGVWGPWSDWQDCSQSCGVGVAERTRQCLPPPPSHQSPPISWNRPAHFPSGIPNNSPVISALRPNYYNNPYPVNERFSQAYPSNDNPPFGVERFSSANQNPGFPLYRNEAGGGPSGQGPVSVFRSPSSSPSLPYGRVPSRPVGSGRGVESGTRRSVSANREPASIRRSSSSIRPGQFGYGRVPFSLPLHRQNRHIRHTNHHNTTIRDYFHSLNTNPSSVDKKETEKTTSTVNTESDAGADLRKVQEQERSSHSETEVTMDATVKANLQKQLEKVQARMLRLQAQKSETDGDGDANADLRKRHSRTRPQNRWPQSRPSRQAPPSYTQTLHRALGPQDPPPYRLQSAATPNQSSNLRYHCRGKEREHRRCSLQWVEDEGSEGAFRGRHTRSVKDASVPNPWQKKQREKVRARKRKEEEIQRVCPGSPLSSRAEQCAAFNSQEFMGRIYDWEPFTEVGPEQQCELICRPVGFRFYVRQAERVTDGTPCANNTSNHVCVAGRCLSEGCDGVLGSGLLRDRCGVCGGEEGSCRRITGSFLNSSLTPGYHKVMDIPPGATAINITQRANSPNYLALRSGSGQSVVNGRWAVDPPGVYQGAGTPFTYTRPKTGEEAETRRGESLSAPGPTTALVQLYVIFHRQNPGIDYEYYIPVEKQRDGERETVREKESERGRAALRDISGVSSPAGSPDPPPPVLSSASLPPFSFPSSSSFSTSDRWSPERPRPQGPGANRNARIPPRTDMPLDNQPTFVWRRGLLTECTASCGKGSRYREIVCVNRHTDQEVHDRRCDSATKPAIEEQACNLHPCPPFWEAGVWSECSASCGSGVQQRQIQCRQSFGNQSTSVHPQRCAGLARPNTTQPCQPQPCSHWQISSNWSSCSVDCGSGKRTRNVRCVSNHGNTVSDRECNARLRPMNSEDCHMGPCVTNWYFSDWSKTCSAVCGPGVQRREVLCLSPGGYRKGDGAGAECVSEKPADMRVCNPGPCTHTHMWYTGPWGQCSEVCGNGTRRREVICVRKSVTEFSVSLSSECSHLEKPVLVQECELQPCPARWLTSQWSACSRSCGEGHQTRDVRCVGTDRQHSASCSLETKPTLEQSCNILPCSPFEDENCKDRQDNCVKVVQARLCVYPYYKTACCASCTQNAQRAKRH
ncbi:hypothetical protein DNTS_002771 [Danionella cerebrum]|uniref:PLAC domain-containing protein n=1 Tax=Danionella cerebrum TaxID=2873325 RepID=A0A553MKV9_9TELE|nr:hypothetical protein DNTS_002771 [Danionella translucida]